MGTTYEQYPFPRGEHPRGWVETTVGDVMFEIRSGYSSGRHNQDGRGIPHLRPMNVSPTGEICMDDVRYVSPKVGHIRLENNDVLFTNTSSTLWVGKTALVEKPGDWGFSNHMTRLRVADGVSPEFAAGQLHYLCLSGYFAFHCKKHVNQSSIAGKQLAVNVPFRLPPASEQKRIACKLRQLLTRQRKLSQQLEALPALIQQYRVAVLQAACTGRLVPTEAELARKEQRDFETASILLERILAERRANWEAAQLNKMRIAGKEPKNDTWKSGYREPGPPATSSDHNIPKSSVWVTLDQLLYGIEAGKSFKCLPHPATANDWGVIKVSAMSWGAFDESENKALPPGRTFDPHDEIHEGDILLSRSNTTELVAASVLVGKTRPRLLLSDKSMRLLPSRLIDREWLQLAISSGGVRGQLSAVATGASGSMLNVSQDKVLQACLTLPPLAEQKRIVTEVANLFSAIGAVESVVASASNESVQLRASLFREAVSGRLAAQSANDEPAAELLQRIAAARAARSAVQKKSNPRRRMKTSKPADSMPYTDLLLSVIDKQFGRKPFTFARLALHLPADYEAVKIGIFNLLTAKKGPRLKQIFNPDEAQMELQQVES